MARVATKKVEATRIGLLDAAIDVLKTDGYAGLTTRAVARTAGAPMSQIQYHFGSKEGLVLALFDYMNSQLLERQSAMFLDPGLSLSEQWDLACDYLDDDLASGYVNVLQELSAAGWTSPEVGRVIGEGLLGWVELLRGLAQTAIERHGSPGPLTADDIAALVCSSFLGAESILLLGLEERGAPVRQALRRFGGIIEKLEENQVEVARGEG